MARGKISDHEKGVGVGRDQSKLFKWTTVEGREDTKKPQASSDDGKIVKVRVRAADSGRNVHHHGRSLEIKTRHKKGEKSWEASKGKKSKALFHSPSQHHGEESY